MRGERGRGQKKGKFCKEKKGNEQTSRDFNTLAAYDFPDLEDNI